MLWRAWPEFPALVPCHRNPNTKMIALGRVGLDKSGIAELTFPNRSGHASSL